MRVFWIKFKTEIQWTFAVFFSSFLSSRAATFIYNVIYHNLSAFWRAFAKKILRTKTVIQEKTISHPKANVLTSIINDHVSTYTERKIYVLCDRTCAVHSDFEYIQNWRMYNFFSTFCKLIFSYICECNRQKRMTDQYECFFFFFEKSILWTARMRIFG